MVVGIEQRGVVRQRPYSIRTRIKTPDAYGKEDNLKSQRPYSIRTRIKTLDRQLRYREELDVRDHIPLEQGLRRMPRLDAEQVANDRDHIPLEQGLRRTVHLQAE